MADKIPATYVSPAVRWSFFMEDYPEGKVEYSVVKAVDSMIPPEFFGDNTDMFVRATITAGERVWIGDKEVKKQEWRNGQNGQPGRMVEVKRDPELFVKLRTQALGRALKQAGYPDDVEDFKLLMNWRRSNRPAITSGEPRVAVTAGEQQALPAGDTHVHNTTIVTSPRPDDEIVDAELVEVDAPDDDTSTATAVERLAELIGSLPGTDRVALIKRAAGLGILNVHAATEEQAAQLLATQ